MKTNIQGSTSPRTRLRQRTGSVWIVTGAVLTGTACFAFLCLLHFSGTEQAWSSSLMDEASVNRDLPDLLSFQAAYSGDTVLVQWALGRTGSRAVSLYRSTDGQVYFELYKQNISAATPFPVEGQYLDMRPGNTTVYYRLSEADPSGHIHVYEPIAARRQDLTSSDAARSPFTRSGWSSQGMAEALAVCSAPNHPAIK
jgi:hypothetical protein